MVIHGWGWCRKPHGESNSNHIHSIKIHEKSWDWLAGTSIRWKTTGGKLTKSWLETSAVLGKIVGLYWSTGHMCQGRVLHLYFTLKACMMLDESTPCPPKNGSQIIFRTMRTTIGDHWFQEKVCLVVKTQNFFTSIIYIKGRWSVKYYDYSIILQHKHLWKLS